MLEAGNNGCSQGKGKEYTMSSLERLAAATFLQLTEVSGDVRSWLPAETSTVPVSTLLDVNTPDHLSDTVTSMIQLAHLSRSPLDPCWTTDEFFKTPLPPRTWLNTLKENLSKMHIGH